MSGTLVIGKFFVYQVWIKKKGIAIVHLLCLKNDDLQGVSEKMFLSEIGALVTKGSFFLGHMVDSEK